MATISELLIKIGVDAEDVENMGSKLAPVAKAAGVAIGGAIVAGAVIGMEQEAVSDKVAAQLRLTEPEAKMAGDVAGRLYADAYGESFEQVQGAVGAVIGTLGDQIDPSAIEGITTKALDWAAAFDGDVTEAVTRVGTLLESGLAKDASHAFDLITAGAQEVAPGLRDELAEATTEYSKFFADLGFTGEETFGLLSQADDKFALDKTGDAIKELSIRATDMSTASTEAFDAMGLDAENMADRILAGGEEARGAFDEIVDGLLSIESPSEQANTAIALFGTPIEDLGVDAIPEFLSSLENMGGGLQDVAGRADEMGDTLNDNAKTKIASYKRSIEQVLAKVVEMPGPLGAVATGAAAMGSVLAPIGPAFAGMAALGGGSLSKLAGVAGTAFTAIKTGFAAMSAFVMANPWVLVIAATVALVTLIVANWDTIVDFLGGVWDWIKNTAGAVWDFLKGAFEAGLEFVKNLFLNWTGPGLLIKHWDDIKEATTTVKDWIVDKFNAVVDFFSGLPQRISNAVTGMWDGLKTAFRNAVNWIIDKWNNFSLGIDLPALLGGGRIALDTPNIPRFHDGGVFEAPDGMKEGLAILESGETVTPKGEVDRSMTYSPEIHFELPSGDTRTNVQYAALVLANRRLVSGGMRGGAR